MGPAVAVIGAVVGAVGQVMQVAAANKAAKAQQRMADLQERQQQLNARRSRRQAIRQAQIIRARAISAGANYGGLQGSGLAGGLSSLGSQLGTELGFSTQMSGISRDINAAQRDFLKAQQQGSMWGAIGGLGFSMFRQAGGFGAFRGSSPGPTSPAAAMGGGGFVTRPYAGGGGGGFSTPRPVIRGGPSTVPGTYNSIYSGNRYSSGTYGFGINGYGPQ